MFCLMFIIGLLRQMLIACLTNAYWGAGTLHVLTPLIHPRVLKADNILLTLKYF